MKRKQARSQANHPKRPTPDPKVKAKSKPEPTDPEETPESIALNALDSYYGHGWTWEQYERDMATSTLGQLQSIVRDALGLKYDLDLQSMSAEQVRQALGSLKARRSVKEHATLRQAWMDKRRPGWSLGEWRQHTGLAYETLRKYWSGITTHQTRSRVRAELAKAENVSIDAVPE